jgi:glycosyltransferase involved in cell wall biosynthesis
LKDTIKYRTIGRFVYSVAVSHRVRDWILSRRMPEPRTSIVENAVDIKRASSPSASRDRLRADLQIKPETICLVLFGWEPDRKGVDIALRGLEPLIGKIDIRLLLAANERADEYVRRTLGRDIPEWAPRVRARDVVADFYAIADIFLSANRLEGFPWSVTEAIAAGTPVISSDIPALAWAKRVPSVTFFPLDRPELLADAVRTVTSWTDEERGARISKGQRIIYQDHSLEAWSRRMAEVYRGL